MEDKELKELILSPKIEAKENLKNRIMHQINAEKVLIPKKQNTTTNSTENHFYIFGIMYILLLTLIAYFYFQTDGKPLQSQTYVISTLFIAGTFNLYWIINVYVDYKRVKG